MDPSPSSHRPIKAVGATLSFFFPGMGHAYAGRPVRGLLWAVLGPLSFLVWIGAGSRLGAALGFGVWLALLFVLFVAFHVAAAFDCALMHATGPRSWVAAILMLVFALGSSAAEARFVRSNFLEAFKIPSGAMFPTIVVGDHIFVDKGAWTPARGAAFVFAAPEHPDHDFVSRVIAVAGDVLEVHKGHPIVNGWEVPSCLVGQAIYTDRDVPPVDHAGDVYVEFLDGHAYLTFYDHTAIEVEKEGPFTVGPNEAWVLGDNRNNAHDSRKWFGGRGGGVAMESFRGQTLVVWMSYDGEHLSRVGQGLDAPKLPSAMASLEPALAKCLASAPSRDRTVPPRAP